LGLNVIAGYRTLDGKDFYHDDSSPKLNLRAWRQRAVPEPLPERAEHIAGMSEADIARVRAAECLHEAERSTSETDKEVWLAMAEKWIALIEDAEQRRGGK
jgi:hypothetical protein